VADAAIWRSAVSTARPRVWLVDIDHDRAHTEHTTQDADAHDAQSTRAAAALVRHQYVVAESAWILPTAGPTAATSP